MTDRRRSATHCALNPKPWPRPKTPGDDLSDDVRALREIHSEADLLMAAWARAQGIGCPSGCGLCCEGFLPDALPVEAEHTALVLLARRPLTAARMLATPPGPAPERCPFYDPSSPAHCSVYEGRPMVCRLFGFSGTRPKLGGWAFRLCRHMPAPSAWGAAREVTGASHPRLEPPPLMGDIEARVQGLRPGDSDRRAPIHEAVRDALERLLFRDGLRGAGDDPPRDGSGGAAA